MKRMIALLLTVIMVLSLCATAGAAESIASTGTAAALRLERVSGTVDVKRQWKSADAAGWYAAVQWL